MPGGMAMACVTIDMKPVPSGPGITTSVPATKQFLFAIYFAILPAAKLTAGSRAR